MNMVTNKRFLDEIEQTLRSFENDIPLEGNPFLLTRIKAERDNRVHKRKGGFALRMSLNQALLLFILLINMITLGYYYESTSKQNLHEKLISALKAEYQIDQSQNNF